MRRVIVVNWKLRPESPFEVFSNLKILSESYPTYNYNTLNNYLSKNKMAYENEEVRIERKVVYTEPVRPRQMVMVGNRIKKQAHNEEKQNLKYWLSRPAVERLEAVTLLRSQVIGKNLRMKKNVGNRIRMR